MLLRHVRGDDIPCRYGGDEFIIVLPDVSRKITRERAEHLCGLSHHISIQIEGKILEESPSLSGLQSFPKMARRVKPS